MELFDKFDIFCKVRAIVTFKVEGAQSFDWYRAMMHPKAIDRFVEIGIVTG